MPITVACTCGKSYPVKEEFAGLQVQCPDCGAVLTIPSPEGVALPRAAALVPKRVTPPPPTRPTRRRSPRDDEDIKDRQHRSSGYGLLVPLLLLGALLLLLSGTLVAVFVILPILRQSSQAEDTRADNVASHAEFGATDTTGTPLPVEKPPPATAPWKGHTAAIRAVGFTVDGRFALSGSGGSQERNGKPTPLVDNSIRFWDAATGKEHRLLSGFSEGIAALAFSSDAHYAVYGSAGRVKDGVWFHGPDFDVHLYDLQAEREVHTFRGHSGDIFGVAISADGRRIVSGSADNTVRVWDAETGKQIHCLQGHEKAIYSVAIAPKGNLAISGGGDQTVRLWDIEEGVEVQKFTGHQDIIWAVAFAADGKKIASAGGRRLAEGGGFVPGAGDFVVRLWDVVSGEVIRPLSGHTDWVGALIFSRDGKRLLSGGQDAVRLWQVDTGLELAHLDGRSGLIRAVAFAPNERRALAGGDDGTLRLWERPFSVPELVRDLRGNDVRLRMTAAREMGRLGAEARPAVPALLQTLTQPDAELRKEVLANLNRIGPPKAKDVQLLVLVLRDGDFPEGRRYALASLASLAKLGAAAEPAVAALTDALQDPSDEIRIQTAELLGVIGPSARATTWKPLLAMMRDADPTVSAAAGAALAKMGSPGRGEVGTLKDLLGERGEPLRRYALIGLAAIGDGATDAVPALLDVAAKDAVPELRGLALVALRKIQPDKKEVVEAFTRALADSDTEVCKQAVQALAAVGPRGGALPGLLQAVEHRNPAVARLAADALKVARLDKSHVPLLEQTLQSKNAAVRLGAIEALGRLGADASHAIGPLCDLLKDATVEERREIIGTLGKMGPAARDAGPRLVEFLKDKDALVSRETGVTLVQIESAEVEQAIPLLIKGLRIENADDAVQVADRDRAHKMLLRIGKPAVHGLAQALAGEFAGGRLTTPAGQANALARLVVVQTLEELGAKANTSEVLLVLARLQGKDPVPAVRVAAKKARTKIQSAK